MDNDTNKPEYDCTYTDDSGVKYPCYVNDKMDGKGGYTGIVYLKNGKDVFEFVESYAVSKTREA